MPLTQRSRAPVHPVRSRRALLRRLPLALLLALLAPAGAARIQGEDPPPEPRDVSQWNLARGGLALDGHDPVAYFEAGGGKPRKGSTEHELVHEGVRYRFASAANRARFEKTPAAFEPAYGGWCAYAMAKGEKVEVDPESFLIRDGRLMLFYKGWLNDTRAKFLKDPVNLARKADAKWKELIAPKEERER